MPPEPWTGIKDAFKFGPKCFQFNPSNRSFEGSEDCLYLNVFTKSTYNRLPVMVWFHGGFFQDGSGEDLLYQPEYFLKNDVVLVSFNYRLGVLGK